MNQKDISFGKRGEDFFQHFSSFSFFYSNSLVCDMNTGEYVGVTDLRFRKKEGEFALPDGGLIEVKSDSRCHDTGNVIVELQRDNGDTGWYQHCKENNVKYLIWNLFRDRKKQYPYCSLMFEFDKFREYVDDLLTQKHRLAKKEDDDGPSAKILIVNLQDAAQHCNPIIAYTDIPRTAKIVFSREAIDHILKNVFKLTDYSFDPDDCVIQTVFHENEQT